MPALLLLLLTRPPPAAAPPKASTEQLCMHRHEAREERELEELDLRRYASPQRSSAMRQRCSGRRPGAWAQCRAVQRLEGDTCSTEHVDDALPPPRQSAEGVAGQAEVAEAGTACGQRSSGRLDTRDGVVGQRDGLGGSKLLDTIGRLEAVRGKENGSRRRVARGEPVKFANSSKRC